MSMIEALLIAFSLVLIFNLKHFVADFMQQTPYMLGKFKDVGWGLPLATHCAVHAGYTFIIVMAFAIAYAEIHWGLAFAMALFDFCCHFIIDRFKVWRGKEKKLTPKDPEFWKLLGLDQMLHRYTDYAIITTLVVAFLVSTQ